MTEHTPGPWTIDPANAHIWGSNGDVVGYCLPLTGLIYGKPANTANARLIAAAPETAAERDRLKTVNAQLLEALEIIAEDKGVSKRVLYLLDGAGQNGAKWNDAQTRARTAIAAAKAPT